MLDVTILKVYHATEKEAKKLRPYIEKCDVFSPENGFATEEQSNRFENLWDQILKSKNRSHVKRFVDATSGEMNYDVRAYHSRLMDNLYLSQRPLFHLERFSVAENKILLELNRMTTIKFNEAFISLQQRKVTSFLNEIWCYRQIMEEITTIRDKHMGPNLDCAEMRIRKRYPHLQQEPLKYSVMIGVCHNIERYTSIIPQISNLTSSREDVEYMADLIIPSQTSFDKARPFLLAYGVREAASAKKIHITDIQIMAMDEPTLENTLREMIK